MFCTAHTLLSGGRLLAAALATLVLVLAAAPATRAQDSSAREESPQRTRNDSAVAAIIAQLQEDSAENHSLTLRDSVLSSPVPVFPDTIPNWESKKNFSRTALEIVGVNGLVWFYDRYVRPGGGAGFRIGFNSWEENIRNGFEWDDNNFSTNQFAHPYHGNLYFNAARSNGYSYWESIPFVFGGSYMWEFFGETHHPAINDWIATSVGGAFLGESFWRLSSMILDNSATGTERTWRELGGFALNPMRGVTRFFSGESFKVHANPDDRMPSGGDARIFAGLRTIGQDHIWDSDTTRVFVEAKFDYGDPFNENVTKPFDHFQFDAQLNFGDKTSLGWVRGRGILLKKELEKGKNSEHLIAGYQHFDYINNNAYEFGGQSVGAAYLSRFETASQHRVQTELYVNAILLGAVQSDYENFSGREYDYGPGVSFKLAVSFGKKGWDYFRLEHEEYWITSINGTNADHWVSITQFHFDVPLKRFYGIGADYLLYLSEAHYSNFEDTSSRAPQLRLYLSWNM